MIQEGHMECRAASYSHVITNKYLTLMALIDRIAILQALHHEIGSSLGQQHVFAL